MITIAELDGTIRSTSVAFERVFGHPTRTIVDKCLFDIVHPRDIGGVRQGFVALTTAEDRRSTLRFRVRRSDDRWVTIEAHAQLMLDEHDRNDAVVMVSRDVSERIALEAELRSAKEEAERASQAKTEFLSRMSHELRTPLNAILGFGQLLEVEALDPPMAGHVDQILRAGDHLLRLINEVLDVGRVESPHLSLHPVSVDAVRILADVVGLVGPLADRAGVHLDGPDQGDGAIMILADSQRVTQVLLNLVSNAIKYNHPGGRVEVGVVCTPTAGEHRTRHVRLWVTDTGPGLSREQIQRLFVPFDRLGLEHAGIEGTGVGLSLSRGLAERMGGSLGVRSRPNEGSTFWVDLPVDGSVADDTPATHIGEGVPA